MAQGRAFSGRRLGSLDGSHQLAKTP